MRNACPHAMTAFDKAGDAQDDRKSSPKPIKRRCRSRCTDPVCTNYKQRSQSAAKGGRPTPTHHHGYRRAIRRQRTPQGLLTATAVPAMTWLPLNIVIVDNDRGDSPSSYPISAASYPPYRGTGTSCQAPGCAASGLFGGWVHLIGS